MRYNPFAYYGFKATYEGRRPAIQCSIDFRALPSQRELEREN